MSWNVLLTYDLPGADGKKREEFEKKLKELGWVRIKLTTTTWRKAIEAEDQNKVYVVVNSDLKQAKTAAKVTCEAAFLTGRAQIKVGTI